MTSHPPPVYPLTTLLYEPTGGFHLLERHYARVNSAAKDLFPDRDAFPNIEEFTKAIWECVNILGTSTRQRVRVVLEEDNQYHVTATPLPKTESRPLSLRLDTVPTPANSLAAHKTTAREIYESARARANADYGSNSPLCDRPFDVLMWNPSGDITETSIANFAVYLRGPELLAAMPDWNRSSQELTRGVYVTPCLSKGLIAGVMRAELLNHGTVVEGTITKEDIIRYAKSPESYPTICFNAVRGLYPVYFMDVLPEPQRAQVGGLVETKDCYPALSKPNPPALTPPLDLQVSGPPTDATTPGTTPALTPISSRSSAGTSSPNQARSEVDAALDSVPVVNHVLPKAFPWRRGVVIDCYDSYTNNLLQLFEHDAHSAGFDATLAAHVTVLRVDQISWPEFRSNILPHLDWVILSPGPGSPHVPEDIGVAGDLLKAVTSGEIEPIPIFGVCLGHQAMAAILGGKVIGSGELVHGRAVPINHDGTGIFEGIDTSAVLQMVRYNSLTVDHTAIPAELKVTATNPEDGEVMGLQHKTLPLYGVQFHPESIHSRRCNYGVDAGKQLVCNFMNIVEDFWATNGRPERSPLPIDIQKLGVLNTVESGLEEQQASKTDRAPIYSVAKHDIGSLIPSFAQDRLDLVFEATSYSPNAPFFWLDSASAAPGDNFARFSYMGPSSFDRCISYDLRTDQVTYGSDKHIRLEQGDTFWHWMDRVQSDLANLVQQEEGSEGLQCGFVGYFGYEMKAGSLPGYDRASLDHSSGPQTPDAQFMFADRLIAYDHWNKTCVALGLVRNETKSDDKSLLERETGLRVGMSGSEFADWVGDLERKLLNLKDSAEPESEINPLPVTFAPNCTSEAYKAGIQKCKNHIADGNSYELCLTGTFTASSREHNLDYWAVYKHLRAHNPATHASFISFPATQTTIMSCSPELFIRFDGANGRHAAMKPIKGTLKRSKCQCGGLCKLPACGSRKVECDAARYKLDEERVRAFINNPKEMAENLMIADLIRANLLEFCGTSSVDCPILFGLETYENVYSLVSTITGELFPSVGTVEGVRRCFPPGSMTGAPKLRSVQLLDGLEAFTRRGIYSGCLGFLSLNNQAVFNVVIRTLVAHKDELSYGAGGAITWLSDAQGEWDEVVLKARSALKDRVPQSS